jgi:hypothetical protein
MKISNTQENPEPKATSPKAVRRRPKLSDLTKLRAQIERDAYRHMRTHEQIKTLLLNLMEISADAKNGWEEASDTLHNSNLNRANNETNN